MAGYKTVWAQCDDFPRAQLYVRADVSDGGALVHTDNDTSGDGCSQEWAGVFLMVAALYPRSAYILEYRAVYSF